MASGLRSGDQSSSSPPGSSTSPAPLRHASSSGSKSVRSSQGRASNSEKTPLLPRIAKAPERVTGTQERGNYGAMQDGGKAKLPDYEIPIWQNQPMWSTGLFDCCADVPMCCFTIFFPCFAFGRNAEALDGTKNSCWTTAAVWWALQHTIALGCLYSASYRGKLRSKYNIPEGPVPDSVIHCLCWPCAFCQEHREIHYRSFGPESWGQTITVAPVQQEFQSSHTKSSKKAKPLRK
ncbi:hypothetical protein M758_10G080200 [Ceratodon purpureus]|uniref:Uncharacterized protein n=1 Tax=Ceratodon purpureus TaxID=3225 RepID=A0A8T0GJF6_CERPU|nr:hypothetical protein KC19_10G081500 [Ceratodon purpureus]KAG0603263.1 hypothetical protein M758_10G080200 [Ceratodon purpureus]